MSVNKAISGGVHGQRYALVYITVFHSQVWMKVDFSRICSKKSSGVGGYISYPLFMLG